MRVSGERVPVSDQLWGADAWRLERWPVVALAKLNIVIHIITKVIPRFSMLDFAS